MKNILINYITEMRIKHYLKNFLIFLPCFFSGNLFNIRYFFITFVSIISFCLMSSTIYIINDIQDIDKDKLHEKKRNRPIASGKIKIKNAKIFAISIFSLSIIINLIEIIFLNCNIISLIILISYFFINICYSVFKWKNIPLLDVVLLSLGFYLRVLMGSVITNITISTWLYLIVLSGAFYMGFGKRRNEIKMTGNKTRKVLEKYNFSFLDRSMNTCMTLSIVFFSFWCMEKTTVESNFLILVPLLIIIFFKYSMNIEEQKNDGDPVDVILNDKLLIGMVILLIVLMISLVYNLV